MQDLSKISVVLPSLDPDEKLVAVIDQNDVAEAVFQQTVDDRSEFFVRVQGRQDHGDIGKVFHFLASSSFVFPFSR